jgi:hypothetical protein
VELENKYFLSIIEKISILIFFYSILFLNSLLNKKGFNNILLKNYLFLELLDVWSLIVLRNLALEPLLFENRVFIFGKRV